MSTLIYLPLMLGEVSHYKGMHVHFGLSDFIRKVTEAATDNYSSVLGIGWVIAIGLLCPSRRKANDLTILGLIWAGYFAFLYHLHYATAPWYYLTLLAMTTLTLDAALDKKETLQ